MGNTLLYRSAHTSHRRLATALAMVGTLVMSSGVMLVATAASAQAAGGDQVFVCKATGSGASEVLQSGNNPIRVSASSLGPGFEGRFPYSFVDGQSRSIAIAYDEDKGGGQRGEPTLVDCQRLTSLPVQISAPAQPQVVDPCGTGNIRFEVPADTDRLAWTLLFNGNVQVQPKPGYVFTGTGQTGTYTLPADSGVLCAAPVHRPVSAVPYDTDEPTCSSAGALVSKQQPTGVTAEQSPAGSGPGAYTITFTAGEGYALEGPGTQTLTVLPRLTGAHCDAGNPGGGSGGEGNGQGGGSTGGTTRGNDTSGNGNQGDNLKVFVCKYVGTPGHEVLQRGNNPISVAVSALDSGFNGQLPYWFADGQGRSVAFAWDTRTGGQQGEPSLSDCPAPVTPTVPDTNTGAPVTPVAPAAGSGGSTTGTGTGAGPAPVAVPPVLTLPPVVAVKPPRTGPTATVKGVEQVKGSAAGRPKAQAAGAGAGASAPAGAWAPTGGGAQASLLLPTAVDAGLGSPASVPAWVDRLGRSLYIGGLALMVTACWMSRRGREGKEGIAPPGQGRRGLTPPARQQ